MLPTDQYSRQRLANTLEMDRINQEELEEGKEKEKKKQSLTLCCGNKSTVRATFALSFWADFFDVIVCGGVPALGSNTWIRFCMKDQCASKNGSKFDSAFDSCSNGRDLKPPF